MLEGGGLIDVAAANHAEALHRAVVALVRLPEHERRAPPRRRCCSRSPTRAAAAAPGRSSSSRRRRPPARRSSRRRSSVTLAPGGTVDLPIAALGHARRADRRRLRLHRAARAGPTRCASRTTSSSQYPQIEPCAARHDPRATSSATRATAPRHVSQYRFPTEPFGPPPSYTGKPFNEDGAEQALHGARQRRRRERRASPWSRAEPNALIDPWFLGSLDENDVQGYAGHAGQRERAHVRLPGRQRRRRASTSRAQGRYFVAVDSRRRPVHGPAARAASTCCTRGRTTSPRRASGFLTKRVAAGRPMIARGSSTDRGAGVDPLSLVIGYKRRAGRRALYDPVSGLALLPLAGAPKIRPAGRRRSSVASDYQESKNIDQAGDNVLPNTRVPLLRLRAVARPTVTWLLPAGRTPASRRGDRLFVTAGSTRGVRSVTLLRRRHADRER